MYYRMTSLVTSVNSMLFHCSTFPLYLWLVGWLVVFAFVLIKGLNSQVLESITSKDSIYQEAW